MLDNFSTTGSEVISPTMGAQKPSGLDSLSNRQQMILERISEGKKYKEIGYELSLSERTIKREMGKVVETLQLQNRQSVKAFAQQTLPARGLLK
jgi:DNA-binding NarL/FixJ family response regulator